MFRCLAMAALLMPSSKSCFTLSGLMVRLRWAYTPLALAEQQLTKREIHRIIEACDFDGWVDDRYSVRGYDLVRGELDC